VIDRRGAIRSVNNATERLFGYAAGEQLVVEAHQGRLTTAPARTRGAIFIVSLSIAGSEEPTDGG
jgi:hypothetical protein